MGSAICLYFCIFCFRWGGRVFGCYLLCQSSFINSFHNYRIHQMVLYSRCFIVLSQYWILRNLDWCKFLVYIEYLLAENILFTNMHICCLVYYLSVVNDVGFYQGWDDPYVPRTHEGLLKWKYPEMNSVDFLCEVVQVLLKFKNGLSVVLNSSLTWQSNYAETIFVDRWELEIVPCFFYLNVEGRS